jgi:DNA helicase-2/ATP-dependent DNA helicase PcrA
MDLLKELNENQREVVETTEGPVLVLAGAGSGKTKALTHRIAFLIAEKSVPADHILAITFTNKAAKEMAERVGKILATLGKNVSAPTMGTFHSVCARMLRSHAHLLGYSNSFVIFDEEDSLKVIRNALKKLNYTTDKISPKTIKGYISNAKNELIDEEHFTEDLGGFKGEVVSQVFKVYQKDLLANDAMDFDDLLFNVVKIFQKFPEVLKKYQDLWQYLLIDEYQDTNEAQYLFAKLLATKNRNLCVVGDDWQSIYSWRGANFQNILNFERDWPEAKVIKLEQNYRCTKSILAAAQTVIERNTDRSEKVLWTDNKSGNPIAVFEARNEGDEGGFICREISRQMASGFPLKNMAVFYRTNAQSRALEEQFLRFRIPYKIVGGVRFYERKEIKDVMAWLRIASGANDWVSFERALLNPPSGLGTVSIGKLKAYCEDHEIKISELEKKADYLREAVNQRALNILWEFLTKIRKIRDKSETSLKEAVEYAIKSSGIKEYLNDGRLENEERLENLRELLSVVEEYEAAKGKLNLADFLEEVALISDLDNYQDTEEAVTLMTLHTSKGLEFPMVFIVGLEENIFPHSRSQFDPIQLEEERRLFYVGLTRAMENLYLTYSVSRLYFGSIQSNLPSRFLTEIPDYLLSFVNVSGPNFTEAVPEERLPGNIRVGDKIQHESFGVGTVQAVSDDELTVFFPGMEEKIISTYYAPIKKL